MPSVTMPAAVDSAPVRLDGGAPDREQHALDSLTGLPRTFKKRKTLPHPTREAYGNSSPNGTQASVPRQFDLEIDTSLLRSPVENRSTRSLDQQARRISSGPDLPPTPPAHSRTSSSTHSALPSSPTYVATPSNSTEAVEIRDARQAHAAPTTPTNQRSPPTPNLTPERTPPGPAERRPKPRPLLSERLSSKATADSRTESFRTAPENPCSSEDEDDGRSTLRPVIPSAKTSQTTVRQVNGGKSQTVGLGLGLESTTPDGNLTPRTQGEFVIFDGEWGANSEVEKEWDDNLERHVTVRKRRAIPHTNGKKPEVVEDVTVTPTNATKALRSLALQESPLVYPRRVVTDRPTSQRVASNSSSSTSMDRRRSSALSSRSTVSTVVEAILVGGTPQRSRTLRHVRKQFDLRDSGSEMSPSSSTTTTSLPRHDVRQDRPGADERARQTRVSTSTFNSLSSHKARREVIKSGAIPVVIIPDRLSSTKSTREPSLRSTSSRRSKRSQSLSSAPLSNTSKGRDVVPIFERPTRRTRTLSESDGSRAGDQRTIDFPPVVPTRSSSLSAPTSRNVSRSGSLTAESIKAHNALQMQQAQAAFQLAHKALQTSASREPAREPASERNHDLRSVPHPTVLPPVLYDLQRNSPRAEVIIHHAPSEASVHAKDMHDADGDRLNVDHHGDPFFGKRLSVQNTPFSQASVETTGTLQAEVSEATAVNIYPHQNKSILMVNHSSSHSSRPSDSSTLDHRPRVSKPVTPVDQAGGAEAEAPGPVTPPQPGFSLDEVDSPLRNPRAPPMPPAPPALPGPPEPPMIQFIPATPSGLTPAAEQEKQLGHGYEATEEKPKRGLSLLRMSLSRRRTSQHAPSASRTPGLLTRTFSLSRNLRKDTGDNLSDVSRGTSLRKYPTADDRPPEENKLHPFWRPASFDQDLSDDDSDDSDDRTYRYPRVDNRPVRQPRRSLSARMKRTFSILPLEDEYDEYAVDRQEGLDRRTIRRTPSGNLRVMKFRGSLESIRQQPPPDARPYTAPDQDGNGRRLRFWRSSSLSRARPKESLGAQPKTGILPTLGDKINIPRRLSERRREKRSNELRQIISGPREVRDGVGDVIRRHSYRETFTQTYPHEA